MKKLFFRIVIKLNELGTLIQLNRENPSMKNEYLIETLYNEVSNLIIKYGNIDERLSFFLQPLPIVEINEHIYHKNCSPSRLFNLKPKYNFLKKNVCMLSLLLGASCKLSGKNILNGIRRSITNITNINYQYKNDINFYHLITSMIESFEYKDDILYTAFVTHCDEDVFIKLIQQGKSNPGYIDGNNNSLLILLSLTCNKIPYINKIAIELIKTGKAKTDHTNGSETALTIACRYKLIDVARELIKRGNILPEFIDKHGNTALIYCCKNEMKDIAIYLIQTGNSNPGHINNGSTALKYACLNRLKQVAILLIRTGISQPGYIDEYGCTPLIITCDNGSFDIAVELLRTGHSNPDIIDCYKCTALLYACSKSNEKIAIEIIKTGESNLEYRLEDTIQYCIENKLDSVYELLASSRVVNNSPLITTENVSNSPPVIEYECTKNYTEEFEYNGHLEDVGHMDSLDESI